MKSRSEEEGQKAIKASQPAEEDRVISSATDYECIQYLFDSLTTTDPSELEKVLASVIEIFSLPAVSSYRKDINRLASSFADSLVKVKTERPFLLFVEMLQRVEPQAQTSNVAHFLLRFSCNIANSLCLLQRTEEKKEESKAAKEVAVELRKERKKLKQEEANKFFNIVEKLLLKVNDNKSLEKLSKGLATIGRKVDFKVNKEEVQGDNKESLVRIFLYGLATKSDYSLHIEIIRSLSTLLGSENGLERIKQVVNYYKPVLSHCTETELETILAPQMVLLIKRSMDSFIKLAPILKSFGNITPHALSVLVQTTLEDLIAQEREANNYQDQLIEVLKHFIENTKGGDMDKAIKEIIENLSYPWKQFLGGSEVESPKQLNLIKILSCFIHHTIPENHQKTFLSMLIELYSSIKQEEVSNTTAIYLSELLKRLPESLYPTLYENYETHIFLKILKATESKNLMSSLLYPMISHGTYLIIKQNPLLANYFPSLKRTAWNGTISQLNFNAVTQFTYNTAAVALGSILDARDFFGKTDIKPDTNLKFIFSSTNTNRQDSIVQRSLLQFEASLQILSVMLASLVYPSFIETQSKAVLPIIANLLLQYSLSPKAAIREQALRMVSIFFDRFKGSKLGLIFAKDYQMAAYAFIKQANESTPYVKNILILIIEMLHKMDLEHSDIERTIEIKEYFIRTFILMHSAKAAGVGRNKRGLAEQMWNKTVKLMKTARELLKKVSSSILTYLVSGKSLMSSTESALVSEDQVQTIINVVITMAREGMKKEVLMVLKKILNSEKLKQAEDLYTELIEKKLNLISRFDLEFLAEEIKDLQSLTENKVEEEKELQPEVKKITKSGKKKPKAQKKTIKPKEEKPLKEEAIGNDKQIITTYMNDILHRIRTEIKNSLLILQALCKEWQSIDVVKIALDLGLLNELKKIIQQPLLRFEGYVTLNELFKPLMKNSDELAESYFAFINGFTSNKYIKICTSMFNSLTTADIEFFYPSLVSIVLDIAEFLLASMTLTSSVKSKAVEVAIRILLEMPYDVKTIYRITPIVVKLLQSSYQGENLGRFLHVFWTRALYNDMRDVVKNIWTYDFPQQLQLLQVIYSVKRPLPNASWLSNVLLQGLFSDNKDMSLVAKNIMNERGIGLNNVLLEDNLPSGLVRMLNYKSKDLRDSAVRAISGYLELRQSEFPVAIKILIKEYDNLEQLCKRTIADIISNISHIIPESELKAVFEFILVKGVAKENEESKEFMESGIRIIQRQGKDHAGIIIKTIEDLLNSKVLGNNAGTIAVIFIGNLARYLARDDPMLPKLHDTLQKMLTTDSEGAIIEVAKCLSYFASIFKEESKEKVKEILKSYEEITIKKIPSDEEIKAKAYALAGYIKGLGVKALDEFEVMKILEEPFKEKSSDSTLSNKRKENSLYVYGALSNTLGKTFEYYAVGCMSYILQSFAIGKNVKKNAQFASKTIISKLSGQGVKSILPSLLKELDTTNWRSKLAAVESLGSMAFMAPKQLSNYLPKIVSNIKVVLNDTQPKVHESGINALTAIGSVIKNPEIADISSRIIQTLNNPTKELIYAIDLLLQQSFAHAIDAPSLSLIIPILDYGLRAQKNDVKIKATQLVRNICRVISDPNDMVPYLNVVIPALKTALFDPIPEVRSSSAKAMGSLCKGLGLENMQDVIIWLKSVMQKEGQLVERSGAAQGYAEIIAEQGSEYLEGMLEQLIEKLRDKSPIIREGYFGLFLFLPISFGESFEKYFTLILPIVLEALADPIESVRNTATKVVQICIRQYGQKRTDVLLEPLFRRMLDSNWKIRESALGLMADLLSVIDKDMVKESPVYITVDNRSRILSILYILRYDNIDAIRITAAQVWKGVVDNQPKTLKVVMPALIGEILELITNRGPELRDVGIETLHDLAERYSEKLLFDILKIFKERIDLEVEDSPEILSDPYIQGIATSLHEILGIIDYKLATENKWNIHYILEPFAITDDDTLRATIANVFVSLIHKDLDNDFQKKLAKKFTEKLLEYEKQGDTEKHPYLQDTIRLMIKHRSKFGDEIIQIFSIEPLTPIKVTTFTAIAQYLATIIFTQFKAKKLLDLLLRTVVNENKVQEAIIGFFQRCTELFTENEERDKWISIWTDFIGAKDNKTQRAKVFLELYVYMFGELKDSPYAEYDKDLFEYVVEFIDLDVGDIPVLVVQAVDATVKVEGKDSIHSFISRLKQKIDEKIKDKRNYLLPIFNKPKTLEILLPIFQNTLTHASVELRVDAAALYCYVMLLTDKDLLKNHGAKIAGPLIRVVNDKFPFLLKNKLLECTYHLMARLGAAIKAFVSPLQTTLIKVINDAELSSSLKSIILRNMTELLKLLPKTDSLRTELLNALKSPNTGTYPTALGALALLGKIHGATMKPEVISNLFSQVSSYLAKLPSPTDENIVAAIAFALMALCQANQEASSLFDLATNKYKNKPEINNYILFALLFSPIGGSESGGKLISNIKGKIEFADNIAVGRAMQYSRLFIEDIKGQALEEVLRIIDIWVPSLESLEWEQASALLELIPFPEFEAMKIESDLLQQIKGKVIRYIAKESETYTKDGAKGLLLFVIGNSMSSKEQIKKWEESKLIDQSAASILLSLIK